MLGPAEDGGWWALALRDPAHADGAARRSDVHIGHRALTVAALLARRLVATDRALRDVDTAADARAVAQRCPAGRFAAAVRDARRRGRGTGQGERRRAHTSGRRRTGGSHVWTAG